MNCTLTAHVLHIHCTCTAHEHKLHCTCTAYDLHMHRIWSAHAYAPSRLETLENFVFICRHALSVRWSIPWSVGLSVGPSHARVENAKNAHLWYCNRYCICMCVPSRLWPRIGKRHQEIGQSSDVNGVLRKDQPTQRLAGWFSLVGWLVGWVVAS